MDRPTSQTTENLHQLDWEPEARWPVVVATLAVGGIHYALPSSIRVGPPWLLPVLLISLLVPAIGAHRVGNRKLNHMAGFAILGVMTAFEVVAISFLVTELVTHTQETAAIVLRAAALLWAANVLIFADWYWRLDAGGPNERDRRATHASGAFLFPQMTMSPKLLQETSNRRWIPGFVDYLFLAFNTSTALSPADTPALSRWAKVLMMVQSTISLSIIVLVAARAVNIL